MVALLEYLSTTYSPDREYVDGVVVGRNVGERSHSMALSDVCVTLQDPGTEVFDTPPLIAVEILSKRDEMSDVLEKLEDYAAFGIPHIWVIDPRRKKAFTFESGRLQEVEGGEFVAGVAGIHLPLD